MFKKRPFVILACLFFGLLASLFVPRHGDEREPRSVAAASPKEIESGHTQVRAVVDAVAASDVVEQVVDLEVGPEDGNPYSATQGHERSVSYPFVSLREIERRDTRISGHLIERVRMLDHVEGRYRSIRVVEQVERLPNGDEVLIGYEVMHGDHVLVGARGAVPQLDPEWMAKHGLSVRKVLPHSPVVLIETKGASIDSVPNAIAAIKSQLSEGAYVEPDRIAFPSLTPNDTLWSDLWGMSKINAPQAWDIATGSPDVVLAIVDTGVRLTHEDLKDNLWVNSGEIPNNGIDDDNNGYVDDVHGWNVEDETNDLSDQTGSGYPNGHGTHVAGTMVAAGNNVTGVIGAGFNNRLMVFATGLGISSSDTSQALDYCIFMKKVHGVNVVATNHSYGSLYTNYTGSGSSTRGDAIERARDAGILTVFAAGNDGKKLEGKTDLDGNGTWYNYFPAAQNMKGRPSAGDWDNVIAVGATRSNDSRASFSNYGIADGSGNIVVDLAAPGQDIESTILHGDDQYMALHGTSMSTPHVTGAFGAIASVNPALGGANLRDVLSTSTASLSSFGTSSQWGGQLDLYQAVLEAQRYPFVQISNIPSDSFFPSGQTIRIEATATDTDGSVVSVSFYERGNATPIGTDNNGADGWSVDWSPSSATYEIYATATDDSGRTTVPDFGTQRVHVGAVYVDDALGGAGWTTDRNIRSWVLRGEGNAVAGGSYGGTARQMSTGIYVHPTEGAQDSEYYFIFKAPMTGSYTLEIHSSTWNNQPTALPVTMTHDGGTHAFTADMTLAKGQFTQYGTTYNFTAGETYTLTMISGDAPNGDTCIADAIRVIPVTPPSSLVSVNATDDRALDDGSDTGTFVVSRTNSSGALTVNLTVSGTATSGSDYTALPTSVAFADGETSKELTLTPIADALLEETETVIVSVATGSGYDPTGVPATVLIEDANDAGVIQFSSTSSTVAEGIGTVALTLSRLGGADGAVSVDITTSGGSASASDDFTAISQTVNWSDQDSADKTVLLSIVDDSDVEPTETIIVTISNAQGGIVINGSAASFTATVTDNEVNPPGSISLTAPTEGQDFVRGQSVSLAASASDPQGVQRVSFRKDGSEIHSDSSAAYTHTINRFWDSSASLVARLIDNADASQDSVAVNITSSLGALPSGWSSEDVGVVNAVGGTSYNSSTQEFYLRGSGANIKNASDEFHFAHQSFNGNGEVIARITDYAYSNNRAKVGIMIRESNAANAPFAMVNIRNKDGGDIEFTRRLSAGANSARSDDGHNYSPLPIWARLVRDGDLFTAYYSEDGSAWTEIGSATISMPGQVIAGLCVTARKDGQYAYGTFDNVTIVSNSNNAPVVSINTPSESSVLLYELTDTLSLSGSYIDDDLPEMVTPTVLWSKVSGPGTVTFGDSSALDTTASFSAKGSYLIRLSVDDSNLTGEADLFVTVGNGLFAHYRLDESSGDTVAQDRSGNNKDATIGSGVTFANGQFGKGAAFGANALHQITRTNESAALGELSAFTVSVWVKPDAAVADNGIFSARPIGEWAGVSGQFAGISMRYDANGWFTDQVNGGNGPPSNIVQSIISVPHEGDSMQLYIDTPANTQASAGTWQHIALVWSVGQAPKVYLDGVEQSIVYGTREGTDNSTIIHNGLIDTNIADASALILGRGALDASSSWDGMIDEFRFYTRALAADEISALASTEVFNVARFNNWVSAAPPGAVVDGSASGFNERANGMLPNGMIYALGIDSLDPADAVGKLPTKGLVDVSGGDHLQIQFRRRQNGMGRVNTSDGYVADGVQYIVEVSDTLSVDSWQTGTAYLEVVGEPISNGDGTETVTVRMKTSVQSDSGGKHFIRLRGEETN